MKKPVTIFLILLVLVSCRSLQEKRETQQRIARVENNLLPAVVLTGDTLPGKNIHDRMKHYHVPGVSIAVMNNGEIEWARAYGWADSAMTIPVDETTLFQAASISKPVAAMAALSMTEEGIFSLDSNVNHYLESWQIQENRHTVGEKVTLRRLLSHSAGLTVHGFGGYAAGDEIPSLIQVLNGEKPANSPAVVPDTTPGTINRYSGGGYTVMQLMMEEASGQSFASLMEERVLNPVGMNNSSYEQPLPEALHSRAARAHDNKGRPVPGNWHVYPEQAAAGLWTTPADLCRFAIEIQKTLAGKPGILSENMVKEMLSSQLADYQGLGLGIGGKNDSLYFQHGGSNAGFKCVLFAFADLGKGAVVMTNGDLGNNLMSEIMRSLSAEYGWNRYRPAVKNQMHLSISEMEKLTGTYFFENNPFLVLEISVEGKQLLVKEKYAGDVTDHYFLPENDSTFFNPDNGDPLIFFSDGQTKPVRLKVAGQWIFRRTVK